MRSKRPKDAHARREWTAAGVRRRPKAEELKVGDLVKLRGNRRWRITRMTSSLGGLVLRGVPIDQVGEPAGHEEDIRQADIMSRTTLIAR